MGLIEPYESLKAENIYQLMSKEEIRKTQSIRRTHSSISFSKMEGSLEKECRAISRNKNSRLLTASKEMVTSVLQPQELESANNLKELGSGFFSRSSTIWPNKASVLISALGDSEHRVQLCLHGLLTFTIVR